MVATDSMTALSHQLQSKAFLDDFSRAQSAAASFDAQLREAGLQFSENYANLLALTARQVMGTIDITISKDINGNWNTSDVKIFMKNIGGAGTDAAGYGTLASLL